MEGDSAVHNPRWYSEPIPFADEGRSTMSGPCLLKRSLDPQSSGDRNIPAEHSELESTDAFSFFHQAHKPHQAERLRLIQALETSAGSALEADQTKETRRCYRTAKKLRDCCASSIVAIEDGTGIVKLFPRRCKSRLCPFCQRGRSFKLQCKLLKLIRVIDSPKTLTLTVKSCDEPLSQQLQRLTENFAKLRKRPEWKRKVKGGIYTIEVTYNRVLKQWHPHLHVIMDSPFFKQQEIVKLWKAITGDSSIVYIEAVKSQRNAVHYMTKYVSKSECVKLLPDEVIAEWALQMQGQRTVSTFGALHSIKLEEEDTDDRPDCQPIAEITSLEYSGRNGDKHARRLVIELYRFHRRRAPDDHGREAEQYQRRGRRIASAIRAWQRRQQEGDDPAIVPYAEARKPGRDPDHRSVGLWENLPNYHML